MPLTMLEELDTEKLEQRGEGKKYAILMAGLKLFGEYGLKGTSVRMIADEAGANVAAIPYYFTNKENLYIEVVTYIGEQISHHMSEVRMHAGPIIEKEELTKEEAMEVLQMMLHNMAKILVESDEPKAWAQIIMREQANPTEAFDVIYEQFMKPMQKIAGKCVAAYMELDSESDEVKIRIHALKGQVLGFLVSRECLLRNLGVKKLTHTHYNLIYQVIAAHIEACLGRSIQVSGNR